jgi:hypothetical protein
MLYDSQIQKRLVKLEIYTDSVPVKSEIYSFTVTLHSRCDITLLYFVCFFVNLGRYIFIYISY